MHRRNRKRQIRLAAYLISGWSGSFKQRILFMHCIDIIGSVQLESSKSNRHFLNASFIYLSIYFSIIIIWVEVILFFWFRKTPRSLACLLSCWRKSFVKIDMHCFEPTYAWQARKTDAFLRRRFRMSDVVVVVLYQNTNFVSSTFHFISPTKMSERALWWNSTIIENKFSPPHW